MTQLDLPPISFARYLELLKRRRWQVIPMSLLGLVVGAVVAFFIPRYYVARTMVVYTGTVLDREALTESDPIYQRVRGAELSVLEAVPRALEELHWIGENADDPANQATIDAVRGRTSVQAYQTEKMRSDYAVVIEYKDEDGQRAADFANKLRETWTTELIERFKENAEQQMRLAMAEVKAQSDARDGVIKEINVYRDEARIERGEEKLGQSGVANLIKNDLRQEELQVTELDGQLVGLRTEVEQLQSAIDEGFIPPTITEVVPITSDPQLSQQVTELVTGISYHVRAAQSWKAGTELHSLHMRSAERLRQMLKQVAPAGAEAGMTRREKENPRFVETLKQINDKRALIAGIESRVAVHRRAVERLQKELDRLPVVWAEYETRLAKLGDIQARLAAANERADDFRLRYERALTGNPFTRVNAASVPPTPTDPNVTLVALAGSLLGLAAAIGLVLLLDVVRSTFKTVDDVNYALKLPVLGVMSHLETEEVRIRSVRQRQTITAVVVLFLVLVLSIVTIYYVAPTRLPVEVLQVLDAILGSGTGR